MDEQAPGGIVGSQGQDRLCLITLLSVYVATETYQSEGAEERPQGTAATRGQTPVTE